MSPGHYISSSGEFRDKGNYAPQLSVYICNCTVSAQLVESSGRNNRTLASRFYHLATGWNHLPSKFRIHLKVVVTAATFVAFVAIQIIRKLGMYLQSQHLSSVFTYYVA